MEIVHYPHPALRWKSRPISEINADLKKQVAEMFELMYEARGIGLAANQVALPFQLFIINPTGDPEEKDQEFVFINPEITNRKGSAEGEEGCLSLPELYAPVRRSSEISVEAFDLDGRPFELELDGLPARVVQHELDHVLGVLFIDRVTDSVRRELESDLQAFESYFRHEQESGRYPDDSVLKAELEKL